MHWTTKKILIAGVVLFTAKLSFTARQRTFPRAVGSFTVGMTEQDFRGMTGLELEPCEGCVKGESVAVVTKEEFPKLLPGDIDAFPEKRDKEIWCFFHNGKMHSIEFIPKPIEIEKAKKTYTKLYGPAARTEDDKNGLSAVIWDDGQTIISLKYVRVQDSKKKYPFKLRSGAVYATQRSDKASLGAIKR